MAARLTHRAGRERGAVREDQRATGIAVTVREAAPADLRDVALVRALSWQAAYVGLVPDEVLESLTEPDRLERWAASAEAWTHGRTLVAEADDRIVGFSMFGGARGTDGVQTGSPGRGEVYAIYLLPQRWRTGIGRALMHATLDELVESGYHHVMLWVLESNDRATEFYEHCGFAASGQRHVPRDFLPEVQFTRRL